MQKYNCIVDAWWRLNVYLQITGMLILFKEHLLSWCLSSSPIIKNIYHAIPFDSLLNSGMSFWKLIRRLFHFLVLYQEQFYHQRLHSNYVFCYALYFPFYSGCYIYLWCSHILVSFFICTQLALHWEQLFDQTIRNDRRHEKVQVYLFSIHASAFIINFICCIEHLDFS